MTEAIKGSSAASGDRFRCPHGIFYYTTCDHCNSLSTATATQGAPRAELVAAQGAPTPAQPSDRELHLAQQAVEGVAWRTAALRVGMNLFQHLPPVGYYDWSPQEWCDWVLAQPLRAAGIQPTPAKEKGMNITVTLTADEAAFVLNELYSAGHGHGSSKDDFYPDCPSCTAADKLSAVIQGEASKDSEGIDTSAALVEKLAGDRHITDGVTVPHPLSLEAEVLRDAADVEGTPNVN